MSNITNLNRDYLIKINVKEATIDVPKMTFWNTDKKTSNMFVQLVINMSTNELISQYVTVQNATDYKITLNVIKPKTKQYKTIEATLLNEEKALFEIDLPDEFTDQVGDYSFEFEVSSKVDSNDESITTSNGTYKVNGSILTNLNEETSSSPDLPILKQLIEQVKSLQGGDLTGYQKKSDNSLETTSKEVVGAINEVNSQFKEIAKKTIVEGNKIYLAKNDGTKLDEGTALPTSSGSSEADGITIKDTGNNFTATNVEGALSELFQSASNGKQLIATAITGKGVNTSSDDTFQTMATNIGKISGVDGVIVEINNVKYKLSKTTDGNITATKIKHIITNNLSNAINSNITTEIDDNVSYTANISADSGYKLKTVTVTMGGVNITNTVYSSGVITIPSVTGNIIITVTTEVDTDNTVGSVDSNNNISLTGLSTGTYTLKYEDDNGVLSNYDTIATVEVK